MQGDHVHVYVQAVECLCCHQSVASALRPGRCTGRPAGGAGHEPAATGKPSPFVGHHHGTWHPRISTDPAYPPQSELVANAEIPAGSKCTGEERNAAEFAGFDIDVSVEIAKRLGVEPCFVTPDWTMITGGNWADRRTSGVGSVTITP